MSSELPNAQVARVAPFTIGPSEGVASQKAELERFLYDRVYRHPDIIRVRDDAQTRLRKMFDGFVKHPEWLPKSYLRRSESVGMRRCVGEYIAGMTDRFCNEQFEHYFG